MILDVFHCLNDHKLINSSLFCHKNIYSRNIRAIHDEYFFDHGVVLLSHHPTNARVIEYIRSKKCVNANFFNFRKTLLLPIHQWVYSSKRSNVFTFIIAYEFISSAVYLELCIPKRPSAKKFFALQTVILLAAP